MMSILKQIALYLAEPVRFFATYDRKQLQPDLMAGITVAVILLPQAIAFALIVELPAQMGLYAAVLGGVVGALWGSSNQAHTGPTNAISLLVLSALSISAEPGSPEFIVAAGLMAVMVGGFQLFMGMARLGVLVNFVSHSVIVGFASGAGVLIVVKQLRHFLGLQFEGTTLVETLHAIATNVTDTHFMTLSIGILTVGVILAARRISSRLPSTLLGLGISSLVVFLLGMDERGVAVIGRLPSSLPPLADLPLFDLDLIATLSAGALAVGAIGLVETTAISRSIATKTGQRLDSNQEFIGQGLANLVVGLFSGYPCAGSFSRSAVNFKAGARTRMSAIFSGFFVLLAMLVLAPLAAYISRAALAGVLILTAIGMLNYKEISRIVKGVRGDAAILMVTFLGTLFLHIEFAVLAGILLSFALYIMNTSVPRVAMLAPDDKFKRLIHRTDKPACPQLGILDIQGDLYFGAVSHVEKAVDQYMVRHPDQRFLLMRTRSVNQCDFSGIHALESILQTYRDKGGDLYMIGVQPSVKSRMESTGFARQLGRDHLLEGEGAIPFLFQKVLDPAVCIYECPVRAFRECQNLPKRQFPVEIPLHIHVPADRVKSLTAQELWKLLRGASPPLVVDVREPREFQQGHVPEARLIPLPELLPEVSALPKSQKVVFICRGGRRSTRAAFFAQTQGLEDTVVLQGGMLAWQSAGLLEAIE